MAKINKICKTCKKEFSVFPSRGKEYPVKYCSMACRDIGNSGKNHHRYTKVRRPWFNKATGYHQFPQSPGSKPMPYHRYLMEQHIGRKLSSNELVHHINGDKIDNRIENLMIMSRSEHTKLHNRKLGRWAKSFDCCINCGTSSIPHQAKGKCTKCYKHEWYKNHC